jgi:hypothetical protein
MSTRKPPLTVVASTATCPSPPRRLGPHGTRLWQQVHAEYDIVDIGGIELLAQACAALDRAEMLADAVAKQGAVLELEGIGPKSHPAIKDELACRAFIVRTLQKLGLNFEPLRSVGSPGNATGIGWKDLPRGA